MFRLEKITKKKFSKEVENLSLNVLLINIVNYSI